MKLKALHVGKRVEVVVMGATPFRNSGEGEVPGQYILAYDDPREAAKDGLQLLREAREALERTA